MIKTKNYDAQKKIVYFIFKDNILHVFKNVLLLTDK